MIRLALLLLLALPARAEEVIAFDVGLRGVTGARLVVSGQEAGDRYVAALRLEATGLVAAFRDGRLQGSARGVVRNGRPVPSEASFAGTGGGERRSTAIRWSGGVPSVRIDPAPEPRPWDLDPAAQGGRADPVSVMWAALRSRPLAEICNRAIPAFDGRRTGEMVLGAPSVAADGTATCRGAWRRVAGYDPAELAERDRFPFSLRWAPAGGVMRVEEIRAPGRLGELVLRRRP